MSRKRLAFFALLLRAAAAPLRAAGDVEPAAPAKLAFTYPCTFAYADGKPYDDQRVMDFECDYMHASLKDAANRFNAMPTLAAQKTFLDDALKTADEKHNDYIKNIAALIDKTDPAKLPKSLSQVERLKRMAALDNELSAEVFKLAAPFLWPPRESESYLEKTSGPWPKSWTPYVQPIYARTNEIRSMVRASEMKLIDQTSAQLEKTLGSKSLARDLADAKKPGGAAPGAVFDGGADRGGVFFAGAALGPAAAKAVGGKIVNALPILASDLKSAAPPIPRTEADRAQRNYFARGAAEGLARLKDDAAVATWHAFGVTTTIGDPYAKAALVFHQDGQACAVASQAEALRARGVEVAVDQLAREGYEKGYYADYATASGDRAGGTPWQSANSLLNDHGVTSSNLTDATPAQLDQAIRSSPSHDAIVYVYPKMFWNDPSAPDTATHAVYLTGEEVDSSGKVRGYYINDTGTNEGARFISEADFNKVWLKRMVALKGLKP
jgi:hypothetical protein